MQEEASLKQEQLNLSEQIKVVRNISQKLVETWGQSDPVSTLKQTLTEILRQVDEEVLSDQEVSAIIYIYEEGEGFYSGVARGPLSDYMAQYPPRKGGTGEYVIQTQAPLFVSDVSNMPPPIPPLSTLAIEQGVKAFANLPLLIGEAGQESLVGVLLINLRNKFDFSEERQLLLRLFADQAAIALQNARVHRRRLREQEAFQVISETATGGQAGKVENTIVQQVVELTKSTYATLWSMAVDKAQLELSAIYPAGSQWQPPTSTIPIDDKSINGYVTLTQAAYYAANLATDPYSARWHKGIQAAFSVPLFARGELIGTLYVASQKKSGITPADQEFVKRLAPHAAIVLYNARLFQLEQRQRREADTLREVAQIVNSTLKREEVAALILQELSHVVDYESASIQLIRGNRRILIGGRGFSMEEAPPELLRDISEDALVEKIIQQKQPVILSYTKAEPLWDVKPTTAHINSWIGAPLMVRDEVIGLLTLDHSREQYYREDIQEVVIAFASQAALAIHNADLYHRLEVLNRSALQMSLTRDSKQTYQAILDAVIDTLECDQCTIFLAEAGQDNRLVSYLSGGRSIAKKPRLYFSAGEGVAGWVYQKGVSLLVSNTAEEPLYKLGPSENRAILRSIIVSPIRQGQKIIGVVSADFFRPGAFDADDLRLLDTLTLQAGTVLQNIEYFNDFQILHDAVTELAKQPTLAEIHRTAVQSAFRTLRCNSSTIFVLDKTTGELVPQASKNSEKPIEQIKRFKLGEGLAGTAALEGRSLLANDAVNHAHFVKSQSSLTAARQRSILVAPVKIEAEVIGVMSASKNELEGFTEHNRKMLETLALDVGIAINVRKQQDRLQTIAKFQEAISDVLSEKEQLAQIYDKMLGVMDRSNMFIALYDQQTGMIEFSLAYENGEPIPENQKVAGQPYSPRRFGERRGLTEWVIAGKKPLLVKNFENWALREEIEEVFRQDVKCCLLAPMLIQDKIIGVIGLQNFDQPGVFDEADRDLLVTIARQAAIALDNARLYDLVNNQLQRRIKELEAVSEFQKAISGVSTLKAELQEIYEKAAEAMSGLMDTRNMYIALYREDTGLIEFPLVYVEGRRVPDEEKVEDTPYGPRSFGKRKGLTEWVIRHQQSLLIGRDFEAWVKAQEDIEAFPIGTKCWLGAPMMLRNKAIGVIGLQNFEREGVFDQNHCNLLEMIAGQAAIAVDNARILDRRMAELKAISQFQQRIIGLGSARTALQNS